MDLLSRFGSTISNKSKDVARKAKELAEISNLNSQISTQEEIIDKLCLAAPQTDCCQTLHNKTDSPQKRPLPQAAGSRRALHSLYYPGMRAERIHRHTPPDPFPFSAVLRTKLSSPLRLSRQEYCRQTTKSWPRSSAPACLLPTRTDC